jgi:hypothetical protein
MKSCAGCRWLLTHARTLCVLVAGALATPLTARASCGDYVTIMPVKDGAHSGSAPGTNIKAQQPSPRPHRGAQPGHPAPHRLPGPCPGPSCSDLPPVSAPVSAASGNPNAERWADPGDPLLADVPGSTPLLPAERNAAPDRHPADVYHPPR